MARKTQTVREKNMFKVTRQADGNQVTPENRAVDVCFFMTTLLSSMLILLEETILPSLCPLAKGLGT